MISFNVTGIPRVMKMLKGVGHVLNSEGRYLNRLGQIASSGARARAPKPGWGNPYSTGATYGSIMAARGVHSIKIGSNLPYTTAWEFGTGHRGGESWQQFMENESYGIYFSSYWQGQRPQPAIRPAVKDALEEIDTLIDSELRAALA